MKKFILAIVLLLSVNLLLAADYTLQKGDVIKITSISAPEITGEYNVSPDGVIVVPYAGTIKAEGKTAKNLTQEVKVLLAQRLKNPEVYVSIVNSTSDIVFVTGYISNPGAVTINNLSNLTTIIASAGDIVEQAKESNVTSSVVFEIKSLDGSYKEVPYKDMQTCDYTPKYGDMINVNIKGRISVNVVGKVNTPGRYTLTDKNSSLMSAVVLAGGFTADADYSKVAIYDLAGKCKIVDMSNYINGQGDDPMFVADNSTIIIPELISGITVLGWVNNQGRQVYRPDQTVYLADVIAQAGGGVKNKARYNEVYVLRNINGELTKTAYNFNNYKNKGDITGNPILRNGDVVYMPCSLQIDWSQVIGSIRSVIGVARDVDDL